MYTQYYHRPHAKPKKNTTLTLKHNTCDESEITGNESGGGWRVRIEKVSVCPEYFKITIYDYVNKGRDVYLDINNTYTHTRFKISFSYTTVTTT